MTKSTEEEWNNKQHNDDIKRVVASFYGNERAIECLSAILRDLRFGEEGGKAKNIFALRDARFHMTSSSLDENFVKFSVDVICMSRRRLARGRSPVMSSFPWDHLTPEERHQMGMMNGKVKAFMSVNSMKLKKVYK